MSELEKALTARPFPAMVARVLDSSHLVINRGSEDGIRKGKRFIVFAIGPEVTDPETGASLGKVELVRGTGIAVHVQERLTTLESDQTRVSERRVVRNDGLGVYGVFGPREETVYGPPTTVPFDEAVEGDFVKPV